MQITDEDVVRTLREVVAERPDYVYKRPAHMTDVNVACLYVHTDEDTGAQYPGCLVGAALHRLGVPLEGLAAQEGQGAEDVAAELIGGLSIETRNFLGSVQGWQDAGDSWAVALRRTEEDMEDGE